MNYVFFVCNYPKVESASESKTKFFFHSQKQSIRIRRSPLYLAFFCGIMRDLLLHFSEETPQICMKLKTVCNYYKQYFVEYRENPVKLKDLLNNLLFSS